MKMKIRMCFADPRVRTPLKSESPRLLGAVIKNFREPIIDYQTHGCGYYSYRLSVISLSRYTKSLNLILKKIKSVWNKSMMCIK